MKKAVVILAEGFEEMEAAAPIDILRRAGIEVKVCAVKDLIVKGSRGLCFKADAKIDDMGGEIDAVILPGGSAGAANLARSRKVKAIIIDAAGKGKIVAAICASPAIVLYPAGLLKGRKAVCYPGMKKAFGADVEFMDKAVVRDSNIITAGGPGAAVAFSLEIVAAISGKASADKIKEDLAGD